MRKACAFGLLILALSPFTAPFQTWYTDHTTPATRELLPAFRDDTALWRLVPARVTELDRVTMPALVTLLTLKSSIASHTATRRTRPAELPRLRGEQSISTVILRL